MKYFITIGLAITLIQLTKCLDFGDDAEFTDDDYEEDLPKPMYNINDAPELFTKFIKDFEKKYANDNDYQEHFKYFLESLKEINTINGDKANTYTVDINVYSDYSPDQKKTLLGGTNLSDPKSQNDATDLRSENNSRDLKLKNDPTGNNYKTDDVKKPIYDIKDARRLFSEFIQKFNKKYANDEIKEKRYKIFVESLKEINMLNSDKETSTTVDINVFSDYTRPERLDTFGLNY